MAKETTGKSQNVAHFLIFIGFLDTMAACVVLMQLAPRVLSIGASPILAGLIIAIYGGVQFFSSSFVGKLGDSSDKKKLLIISMVMSAVSYLFLGYKSLVSFSIARIFLGAFKHTHLLAQSYLTDIVPVTKKNDYFGYFGGGIGLGFIVGPTIAGHLAEWEDGFPTMTKFTAIVFLVNAALVWAFLPNSSKKNMAVSNSNIKRSNGNNNKVDKASPKNKNKGNVGVRQLWDVILLEVFSELSAMVYFTNFVGILMSKYALSPKNLGYTISMIGVLGMTMAMVSGRLNRLAGKILLPVSMTLMFSAFLSMSFLPPYWLILTSLFTVFGTLALLRTLWPSLLTSRFSADKASSAVGMSNSVMAISSMGGPVLAGIATEVIGDVNGAAMLAAAVSSLGALATVWLPRSEVTPKAKTS